MSKSLNPLLKELYDELLNEVVWLNARWRQYEELFETSPSNIGVLNEAAGLFFRIIQEELWNATLLQLSRLTDRSETMRKDNLSLQALSSLIEDTEFKEEITSLVEEAVKATTFARDWRNRKLAHTDLKLALNQKAKPLATANRKKVTDAIKAVSIIIQRLSKYYFEPVLYPFLKNPFGEADSLLYVVRGGLKADEERRVRIEEGKHSPEDIIGPNPI
ncbi:hypothetical protein ES708_31379 [subsurface metagenome]